MKKNILFITILFSVLVTNGQQMKFGDSRAAHIVKVGFGFGAIGGDWGKLFVNSNVINAGYQYKFKNNFYLGFQGNYLFYDGIKNDSLFNYMLTKSGGFLDAGGRLGALRLGLSGFSIDANFGKLFPLGKNNLPVT